MRKPRRDPQLRRFEAYGMQSILVDSACGQAERLYNQYVEDVGDLTVDDTYLDMLLTLYYETLEELRGYGVEGIRINKKFVDIA